MTRRAAKADANQPEIVKALRAVGATVTHLHMVGSGCPDIVVGFRGSNYLIEIKDKGGKLNDNEKAWFDKWRGSAGIAYSPADALMIIGAIEGS